MYRITVTYAQPEDPAAFDRYYAETHTNLALAMPGLISFTTIKAESLDAEPTPWYFQANLYFADQEAALAALGSDAGRAAGEDIGNFATGGATIAGGNEVLHDVTVGAGR